MSVYLAFAAGLAVGCAAAGYWACRRREREARLLSFLAHELITPLTSVNMTVLNFLNGVFGPLGKDHVSWMQIIRDQSYWLGTLVGDFRDLVHMKFHKDFQLAPEDLALEPMIRETLAAMEGSITRTGVTVKFETSGKLPEVFVDRERIQRVLANLIAQAKKFQTKGQVAISMSPVAANGGKSGVETVVSYVGPKLSEEETNRILDLYYPIDANKNEVLPCVGLGLGMCNAIVRAHGGEMTFSAADGANRIAVRLYSR